MAGLGSLTIDLAANISKFERALDRAERMADKRSKGIQRTFKRLSVGVGAAIASFGLIRAVDNALDFADSIGKAADRAGIATGQLQELRFAADKMGVSTQQLDDGVRRFTRRLGVALADGSFKKDFEELGVSIRDAGGNIRQSGDVLDDVIIQMGKLETQAQKSKVAAQLFGDDAGPQLALLLGQGSDAVNELRQQARSMGIVMSEDVVRSAEEANDQLSALSQVLRTQMATAIIQLAPLITDVATGLSNMAAAAAQAFTPLERLNIDQATAKLAALTDERIRLTDAFIKAKQEESEAGFLDSFFGDDPEEIKTEIDEINQKIDTLTSRIRELRTLEQQERQDTALEDPAALQRKKELADFAEFAKKQNDIIAKANEKRRSLEASVQADILNMRMAAFSNAASLIRALAPESKKAAIVALAIEKGIAIAQIGINTQVAAMKARAALIQPGNPASVAVAEAAAARIQSLGAISQGLVLATGLAQAHNINTGGGGGATGGGAGTVAGQTATEEAFSPFAQAQQQRGSITINVTGVVTEEIIHDLVIPAIQSAVDDRDVVLIRSDSRNAQELING